MFFKIKLYEKNILNSLQKFKMNWKTWSHKDPSWKMFLYKSKYEESHMGYYVDSVKELHVRKRYDWLDRLEKSYYFGGNLMDALLSGCYALMNYYYLYFELTEDMMNSFYHEYGCYKHHLTGTIFLEYKGFRPMDWNEWLFRYDMRNLAM